MTEAEESRFNNRTIMWNEIQGTILQLLFFTGIPFLVFLIRNRTAKGFMSYIGLKGSTKRANYLALIACLLFALPLLALTYASDDFRAIMFEPHSITGKFRQMGLSPESILLLLLIAIFKTALSEEIFFRGFVAKRLIGLLGYQKGNVLQAALFGGIHAALFSLTTSNAFFLAMIFLIPGLGAYVSAFLNERMANGSIIPGWISHGLANVFAYSMVGFVL